MSRKPVTVTALNNYIGRVLKSDPYLSNIYVIGEITGLKYHSSGHVYFSIVDADSKINCFLPKSIAYDLGFILQDGMSVIISGNINVYEKGGTYSILVRSISLEGEGSLALAFEAIKEKLAAEGLFDSNKKKELPRFPKKIGIVTSETGAAIEDIIKTVKKKNDKISILLFPALVQGEYAAADISAKIKEAGKEEHALDILIVGRGGGSKEDLWPFNEEIVARAIYDCKIPVISAVGHEVDFSISDLVADVRAATPTAAAEIASYDSFVLETVLEDLKKTLLSRLVAKSDISKSKLDLTRRLIEREFSNKISNFEFQVEKLKISLEENRPYHIMEKGYGIATDNRGKVISSVKSLASGDKINLSLKDGSLLCQILEIRKS